MGMANPHNYTWETATDSRATLVHFQQVMAEVAMQMERLEAQAEEVYAILNETKEAALSSQILRRVDEGFVKMTAQLSRKLFRSKNKDPPMA